MIVLDFIQKLLNSFKFTKMSVKFGEIDVAQIVDNEYKIKLLLKTLTWLLSNNPQLTMPTQEQVDGWKSSILRDMREKYPESDLKFQE